MYKVNITIKDIDDLKNHISESVTHDVQNTMSPLIEKLKQAMETVEGMKGTVDSNCKDIKNLKANQAKALVGWTVLSMGVALLFGQAKTWIMSKIHFN